MDKPISVGDLVVVTRIHCEKSREWLGTITTVRALGVKVDIDVCAYCRGSLPHIQTAAMLDTCARGSCYPQEWIKRIPPLEELEGVDSLEELNTPVLL